MPRPIRALALAAMLLTVVACRQAEPVVQSVVLVTLDTTRADALGCYRDDDLGHTPRLDALARESLVFDRARTVAPLTLPAHASMMTGLWPPAHGVRDNGLRPLPSAAVTLAERAREAGLQTAAFVAAVVLDPLFGLDQGFEVYDAPSRADEQPGAQVSGTMLQRPAGEVLDAALAWLAARDAKRPFLLWVHLFDPHRPLAAPEEFVSLAGGDPYLAEVAVVDRAVGRLLAALAADGVLDETLVLVVGDHGESQGEHGEETHGVYCYESTLRVPFLVRYPDGHRAGERSTGAVSVADVQPTVLAALGLAGGEDVDGLSLYRTPVPSGRGVYFESYYGFLNYGWSPLAGWARADVKYLHSATPELFDLRTDAAESQNLFGAPEQESASFERELESASVRTPLHADEHGAAHAELQRALEQLGYATAAEPDAVLPGPLEPTQRPSPLARRGEFRRLQEALWYGDRGHSGQAIQRLEVLVESAPANPAVREALASYLIQQRRHAEALTHLLAAQQLGVERPSLHNNLGVCLEATGEPERALLHYRRALALDPHEPDALRNAARLARELEHEAR